MRVGVVVTNPADRVCNPMTFGHSRDAHCAMSRLARRPGGDGALHLFAHQQPEQVASHLRDPHELRVYPELDSEVISAASYDAPEQRRLIFRIETGDAIDIGHHRLCFNLRVPTTSTTTGYTPRRPAPLGAGGVDLRPLATAISEPYWVPRVEHACQLFRRLVVRDSRGEAIVDAEDFNAYLSIRRWLESEMLDAPPNATDGGVRTPANAAFNTYDTTAEPGDRQALFTEEGLRVCMRIEHPFFTHGSPVLLRPQRLTIELYLEDVARAFTTQACVPFGNSERSLTRGWNNFNYDVASLAGWTSLIFPAGSSALTLSRKAIARGEFCYEILRARFYVRCGRLSEEMQRRAFEALQNGVARSCVDYLIQKNDYPRAQLEFEIRLRDRLTNLRRTMIAPYWRSNLARIQANSFDTTAAAIDQFEMLIQGQTFPRFGRLESQDEIFEYVFTPVASAPNQSMRLNRELFMGSNSWLTQAYATDKAVAYYDAPYGAWFAPRAFMLAHLFQPDGHELLDYRSLSRAGGISVAFEDPVLFRIRRSTNTASWPASVGNSNSTGRASSIGYARSEISSSYWRTSQNQRGSFVVTSESYLTTAGTTNKQQVPAGSGNYCTEVTAAITADTDNSSLSTDTLQLWLYAEYTTRITEHADGRITVER